MKNSTSNLLVCLSLVSSLAGVPAQADIFSDTFNTVNSVNSKADQIIGYTFQSATFTPQIFNAVSPLIQGQADIYASVGTAVAQNGLIYNAVFPLIQGQANIYASVGTAVAQNANIYGQVVGLPTAIFQLPIINNVDGSNNTNTLEQAIEGIWFYGWDTHAKVGGLVQGQTNIIANVDSVKTGLNTAKNEIKTEINSAVDGAVAGLSSALDTGIDGINTGISGVNTGVSAVGTGLANVGIELDQIDNTLVDVALQLHEMGLLKNEVTLALAAIDRTNQVVADPDFQTAFDILATDAGGFVAEIEAVATSTTGLADLINNVNDVTSQMPTGITDDINSALGSAQKLLNLARAQVAAAEENHSQNLHANPVALLTSTVGIINVLKNGMGADVNIGPLAAILSDADDVLPAPLKAALGEAMLLAGINQEFVTRLQQAVIDAPELIQVIGLDLLETDDPLLALAAADNLSLSNVTVQNCAQFVSNRQYWGALLAALSETGVGIKIAGAVVKGFSSTAVHGPFSNVNIAPGVHGYAALKIEHDNLKMIGETLDGAGDLLIGHVDAAGSSLRQCEIRVLNRHTLATVEQLFVDIVGVGPRSPGEPMHQSHTLAGIGDNIGNAQATLGLNSAELSSVNSKTNYTRRLVRRNTALLADISKKLDSETTSSTLSRPTGTATVSRTATAVSDSTSRSGASSIRQTGTEVAVITGSSVGNTEVRTDSGPENLWLQVRIEESLMQTDGGGGMAILYRPQKQGGHIELVREIVSNMIDMNNAGGYQTGRAMTILAEGDSYLSSGYYKEAWDAFGRAYREAL